MWLLDELRFSTRNRQENESFGAQLRFSVQKYICEVLKNWTNKKRQHSLSKERRIISVSMVSTNMRPRVGRDYNRILL